MTFHEIPVISSEFKLSFPSQLAFENIKLSFLGSLTCKTIILMSKSLSEVNLLLKLANPLCLIK